MAHPSESNDEDREREQLTLRPGNQAGWDIHIEGAARCHCLGHEVESMLYMPNGLLIAYCVRCSERFEAPWFRGGTAVTLAEAMSVEAMKLQRPSSQVITDLQQVQGLLTEDLSAVQSALRTVQVALGHVKDRLR